MKNRFYFHLILGLLIVGGTDRLIASDHADGLETYTHPSGDITDLFAFPSPQHEGVLVMAMNVYPLVNGKGHFSDHITYRFTLKPVSVAGQGLLTGFTTGATTYRFDCTVDVSRDLNRRHVMTCQLPDGKSIETIVNNEKGAIVDGVQIFAGRRADPFLLNIKNFAALSKKGVIPKSKGRNDMGNLNVLSIVIAFKVDQFTKAETPLLAIVGETLVKDPNTGVFNRIDRVGRPEITNALLIRRVGQKELRDLYNQADAFAIEPELRKQFAARLHENLTYYDGIDDHQDWLPGWDTTLVELLLHDYLVVDPSKEFVQQSFFDIENSLLRNQPHTRPGGRVPHENILNALFTTMVNGGHGPAVANGISSYESLPQADFPYLAKPQRSPWSWLKTLIGRIASDSIAK